MSRWLSIEHAAELLDAHPETVRTMCRKGLIPHTRLPGSTHIRIEEIDLDAVMRRGKTGGVVVELRPPRQEAR